MQLFLLLFGHAVAIFSAEDLSEDLNKLRKNMCKIYFGNGLLLSKGILTIKVKVFPRVNPLFLFLKLKNLKF